MDSGNPEWNRRGVAESDLRGSAMRTLDLSRIGKVYIACGYTDMRRGINGLVGQIQQQFRLEVREQAVFLFCGRRSDRFKALFWDGDGFVLLYKRLEYGKYQWTRRRDEVQQLSGQEYRWLMEGLSIVQPKAHRKVNAKDMV